MAELVAKEPLFKGKNELDQLGKVILASYLLDLLVLLFFWSSPGFMLCVLLTGLYQ